MKITQDEGWREIQQSLIALLESYSVPEEKAIEIVFDIGNQLDETLNK